MESLLEQYASTGQASMLHLMMLAGVSPNIKGKDGRTLAHHAAIHAIATGNAEAIRKLADYGGCMHVKDAFGNSPLDILRAKPALYTEINKAVLRGIGNAGIKDSNTISGKTSLTDKKKRNQKTIKMLRGAGAAKRPLGRPKGKGWDKARLRESPEKGAGEQEVLVLRPGGARN